MRLIDPRLIFFWGFLILFPLMSLHAQVGEPELAEQYFQDEEYANALALYSKLQKKEPENRAYNLRLVDCHRQLAQYDEAISHLERVRKRAPQEPIYPFVLADVYRLKGDFKAADNIETQVIEKQLVMESDFMQAGAYLFQARKNALALRTYLQARKTLHSKFIFSPEIANLYFLQGQWAPATEEYISQYEVTPAAVGTITTDVLNIVRPESKAAVEQVLLDAVNRRSDDIGLRNMLFEFYVLTENFMEAFVQVKSIDRVFKENGARVHKYAETLRNNKQYKLANKALDYIIESHPDSPYFLRAYQDKTVNGELLAFESLPLDTAAIREAVVAYDGLLSQFGRKAQFFDAIFRKSKLLAFHLFELDEALAEMEGTLDLPLKAPEKAEANLLMGDILLMQKQYSKAVLKYDEVANTFKEGQIGALAKYKQGRLSYFKGDFEFSKARLQTIKDNTSNDISNDAIQLFLTIQDNIGMDTTVFPLQRFAQAQLMVFQRDYDPALVLLDSISYAFPNHTLTDEILWEKANIFLTRNEIDKAVGLLDRIIQMFGTDIHGDDALYTKARIYDYTFQNKEQAMQLYIDFLKRYSGSLYVVEVRKRIRELRTQKI
jgi:tetratricopeptide (TPR) repeat protein